MENQNTRLINPRENRKIHLLTRFTGNNLRQTEPVYRLQRNPSSHEPSKETFRHYTPFPPPNNLIANVDLRATITSIHELPSNRSPRHNGGRIYLSLGLSGIRKIRLAIKSSFPATGRGRLLQVRLGKRKRDKRMFRLPNVTTWMMDDTLIVGIYAPRLFRPTIFG